MYVFHISNSSYEILTNDSRHFVYIVGDIGVCIKNSLY